MMMTTMSMTLRFAKKPLAALMLMAAWLPMAHADGVATLRAFVKDVNSGRGNFTQLVTSPDGKKTRKSSGSLEFQRPNRFRFAYATPTEQLIVGDGKKVWLWDSDLNQVTVRPMSNALGATPAALLSGGSLDKDFTLKDVPAAAQAASGADSNMEWVEAIPRSKDGQFRSVRVGFKAGVLAALVIEDGFGQRSRLDFAQFESRVTLPATRFQFTPPAGADVLNQP
jgi:outer membrane lipoprotein carrier protein